MKTIKIVPKIKLEDKNATVLSEDYANNGADMLLLIDDSKSDEGHEENIARLKKINELTDVPFITGGNSKRLEDIKKYLYAGAEKVFIQIADQESLHLMKEAFERFGKDKIAILIDKTISEELLQVLDDKHFSLIIISSECLYKDILLKDTEYLLVSDIQAKEVPVADDKLFGVSPSVTTPEDILEYKRQLIKLGARVFSLHSSIDFSEFKKDENGLVPVVVQDYKTGKVLMMAYMNLESFNLTIETGRMTYFSRSRQEIWVKGLTSGHYQYVKELNIDCDKDTLLAKVFQVGAACHTGSQSCFFTTIAKKEYKESNPYEVFEKISKVILDRKINPKEGSYTNYLFDKGIDKILKKLGEEAVEIIIAAKNPDPEEIKYEISDFLYHMMVLMAEKNVTWEEITDELNRR